MNSHDCKVTLVASGSEVELALDVHDALKNNIESKVVSVKPRTFYIQTEDYKKVF